MLATPVAFRFIMIDQTPTRSAAPRPRWLRTCAAAAVALWSLAAPAPAQKKGDEVLPPYDITGLPHEKQWVPWVFAFLFLAGAAAIAFKNPHRTHLD